KGFNLIGVFPLPISHINSTTFHCLFLCFTPVHLSYLVSHLFSADLFILLFLGFSFKVSELCLGFFVIKQVITFFVHIFFFGFLRCANILCCIDFPTEKCLSVRHIFLV